MKAPAALLNGVCAQSADPSDRGLHYGDGVFRTVRVVAGQPRGWAAHRQRLLADCAHMGLPEPDMGVIACEAGRLFADGGDGALKILITRGGGRGYAPPQKPGANRWLFRYPLPVWPREYSQTGVAIDVCTTPIGTSPALAGVKHCNRLEQVLARHECIENGWPEALMRTVDGRVICGTMSNLFVVRGQDLITPEIIDAGVAGATRQRVMAACRASGQLCRQQKLDLAAARAADEIFLCNSLMEIWPVRAIGRQRYPVGAITRRCQEQLADEPCAGF